MKLVQKALACIFFITFLIPNLEAAESTPARFSYNYVQAGYIDMDGGLDGLTIAGSHDIMPAIAINASYANTSQGNQDYKLFSLGASYHGRLDLVRNSDMALHGEFVDASRDSGNNNNDDNGLRVGALLRYQAQPNLELFGDISFTSLYDNDLILTEGLALRFNNNITTVVTYEASDNDSLSVALRFDLK